jgi:hypothetical protein
MIGRRWFAGLALAASATMVLGCGGSSGGAKTANVQAGDMPESAEWTGVYYSPLYGYIHLVQEGNTVSGKWQRPDKSRWADINGEVTGNLFKFAWTEYAIGVIGPGAKVSGRGYMLYSRPPGDNVDDTIAGQIGRGDSELGAEIDGIKQRNVNPDPDSIGGSSPTDVGGGDWDGESKETGAPEEPAPPPP